MKSTIVKPEPTVHLELTISEARWLRAIIQNPLLSEGQEETMEDYNNRLKLWEALNHVDLQE